MKNPAPSNITRRSVRAILIDADCKLILIKRTKTGQTPYWTTPGGGIEEFDHSMKDSLARELMEELGAVASIGSAVFLTSNLSESGIAIQYFFVAKLTSINLELRDGPEFQSVNSGGYELDRISLNSDALDSVDLKPQELKEFITRNREALLHEAKMCPYVTAPK